LLPLLFNFAVEYAIKEVPGKPGGTEIIWDTSALVYADCVHLVRDNISTINKNTEMLTDASKEFCLEINLERVYVSVSSPEFMSSLWHENSIVFDSVSPSKY
jgi:hypothetical protein